MANFKDYMKEKSKKEDDFFFGAGNKKQISNKYFTFKRVLDDDNIIIVTNNIDTIKNSFVLIVGNNKAVFLKAWQVREAHSWESKQNFYIVKLSRKYFKTYTFSSEFSDFYFDKDDTFDDLLKTAKEQDSMNMSVANGFLKTGADTQKCF